MTLPTLPAAHARALSMLAKPDVDISELAVRLGLDRSAFEECLRSHAAAPRVEEDIQASIAHRMNGTPTFVMNGRMYLGGIPETELTQALQSRPAEPVSLRGVQKQ